MDEIKFEPMSVSSTTLPGLSMVLAYFPEDMRDYPLLRITVSKDGVPVADGTRCVSMDARWNKATIRGYMRAIWQIVERSYGTPKFAAMMVQAEQVGAGRLGRL